MMPVVILVVIALLLIACLFTEATGKGFGAFAFLIAAFFVLAGWVVWEWLSPLLR